MDAPLLKQPLHFMPDQSAAPSWMTETLAKIKESAGFVIVSAEYNCTIPPALTNLLDHFPLDAYRHKPASIVTYTLGNTPFQLIEVILISSTNNAESCRYLLLYHLSLLLCPIINCGAPSIYESSFVTSLFYHDSSLVHWQSGSSTRQGPHQQVVWGTRLVLHSLTCLFLYLWVTPLYLYQDKSLVQ